jgi:hypothetical protein
MSRYDSQMFSKRLCHYRSNAQIQVGQKPFKGIAMLIFGPPPYNLSPDVNISPASLNIRTLNIGDVAQEAWMLEYADALPPSLEHFPFIVKTPTHLSGVFVI